MEACAQPAVDMLETYRRMLELQKRLRSLHRRITRAERYLLRQDCNQELGRSRYDRLIAQWDQTVAARRELDRHTEKLLRVA